MSTTAIDVAVMPGQALHGDTGCLRSRPSQARSQSEVSNQAGVASTAPATYLLLDGWAGRRRIPVKIVGRTRARIRVKLLEQAHLPGRRIAEAGEIVLVPAYAIETAQEHGEVIE